MFCCWVFSSMVDAKMEKVVWQKIRLLVRDFCFTPLLDKMFNCICYSLVNSPCFLHFFEVVGINIWYMLSSIPFVRPGSSSWPISKSFSNNSVEWIKDILLVKGLIFLTGSFFSLSLSVSFSDGACWIFSLSMSSESSESMSKNSGDFGVFFSLLALLLYSVSVLGSSLISFYLLDTIIR